MSAKHPEVMFFRCNRCNRERTVTEHPCPACRCPEYRIEYVRAVADCTALARESQPLLKGFVE